MFPHYLAVKWRIGLFCILPCVILTAGCKKKPAPAPPPEVLFITVAPTNVPVIEEWIGTLEGLVNAQIQAQVTGYLWTQDYPDGGRVKKGDLLFQIDPRPFQAVLDQALARLAQDQAVLAKSEIDLKRYTPLVAEQAISQEILDDIVQTNRSTQAAIKADEAAIESARLNLGFTRLISPIDGLAGIAQLQVGNLVGPSGSALTTVSTVDPIRVYFQASEQSYLTFWRYLVDIPVTNQSLILQMILSDGSVYSHKGRFYYADRQVNPTTGTLQIVGLFPNPDYLLRPGQYSLVRAQTQVKTNAIVVPQRAVAEVQGAYQVTVIEASNKAHVQNVQVGVQFGSDWVIEKGLKPGDRVVVEGIQKAKEGTVVNPKPFAPQTNSGPSTNSAQLDTLKFRQVLECGGKRSAPPLWADAKDGRWVRAAKSAVADALCRRTPRCCSDPGSAIRQPES
ncbi:MAG: efflux transporter, family, subunit [Pedosphaera sp.]|nr:efflux transporter, family, subunit [Pedosphaera sp.]